MFNKKTASALLVLSFIFAGCGDKPRNDQSTETVETKQPQTPKTQEKEESKETIGKVADTVTEHVETTAQKIEKTAKQVQEAAQPVIKETVEKVSQAAVPAIDTVKKAVSSPDGAQLYGKCASCHGAAAQNKALGKSQIIKGWSEERIANALKGYKNGTYGGVMKGIMKPQVESLSDKEIEALSKHIASF